MIARMTEAWIFACGFLFLSFRGNAPLFRGIMAHERGRQVFDAGSVEGGGEDNDSQGHVPHLHGVVGVFSYV